MFWLAHPCMVHTCRDRRLIVFANKNKSPKRPEVSFKFKQCLKTAHQCTLTGTRSFAVDQSSKRNKLTKVRWQRTTETQSMCLGSPSLATSFLFCMFLFVCFFLFPLSTLNTLASYIHADRHGGAHAHMCKSVHFSCIRARIVVAELCFRHSDWLNLWCSSHFFIQRPARQQIRRERDKQRDNPIQQSTHVC